MRKNKNELFALIVLVHGLLIILASLLGASFSKYGEAVEKDVFLRSPSCELQKGSVTRVYIKASRYFSLSDLPAPEREILHDLKAGDEVLVLLEGKKYLSTNIVPIGGRIQNFKAGNSEVKVVLPGVVISKKDYQKPPYGLYAYDIEAIAEIGTVKIERALYAREWSKRECQKAPISFRGLSVPALLYLNKEKTKIENISLLQPASLSLYTFFRAFDFF